MQFLITAEDRRRVRESNCNLYSEVLIELELFHNTNGYYVISLDSKSCTKILNSEINSFSKSFTALLSNLFINSFFHAQNF